MKAPRKSFRARLARLIAGTPALTARRRTTPDFTPPEDLLTSFETYALEHRRYSKRLEAYCASNPRIQAVSARYEAAQWSPDRTYLNSYLQDAENDVGQAQRELMRLMRWFEKNNPTLQKILDLLETNVVGTGLNPTPTSASPEWNRAALKWWANWCDFADIGGRQHFYQLQSIIVRTVAVDGEVFIHITSDPKTGRPRIALIEAHRVTSARVQYTPKMLQYHDADGVLLDKDTGQPRFYVVQGSGAAEARVIPAAEIVHIYEPSRANQFRGITLFHAITNTLHDLNDLQKFEMQAAKTASVTADVIHTASGEMPESLIGGGMLEPAPLDSPEDKQRYYAKQFGSSTRVLQTGDKWEQSKSDRPSPAMRDFWQYLERKVCQGVGISAAAVLDYEGGWGGAALRGAIACDNRFYECRSAAITGAMQRIWEYAVGWAIENKDADGIGQAPDGWKKPKWQAPRRSTVDIGRDSASMINELRAGLRTYADIYGEAGADSVEKLTQRADEAEFIAALAAKRGLNPQAIAALDAGERGQALAADRSGAMDTDVPAPATPAGEAIAPALIEKIGIGGTQALIQILQQVSTGVIPREQGISTLSLLFGISETDAASMVPEQGSGEIIENAGEVLSTPTA